MEAWEEGAEDLLGLKIRCFLQYIRFWGFCINIHPALNCSDERQDQSIISADQDYSSTCLISADEKEQAIHTANPLKVDSMTVQAPQ
jgi:hypothetical protein